MNCEPTSRFCPPFCGRNCLSGGANSSMGSAAILPCPCGYVIDDALLAAASHAVNSWLGMVSEKESSRSTLPGMPDCDSKTD